jgi:putative copper export protein
MTSLHTLSLSLHLVALAFWLGGMAFFLIVFAPAAHDLEQAAAVLMLNQGRRSFEVISWAAIAVLFLTGIFSLVLRVQASGVPVTTGYTVVLSLKLFLFFAMLIHHCLQVFKYGPKIAAETAQLPCKISAWPESLLFHWRKWFFLLKINAAIGPIVTLLGLMLAGM